MNAGRGLNICLTRALRPCFCATFAVVFSEVGSVAGEAFHDIENTIRPELPWPLAATATDRQLPSHSVDSDAATSTAIAEWMHASLDALVRLIERVAPGMRGSVLILDEDGVTLRHGAAPHLPEAYCRLIDGERIGPAAGSCGTAAYRREQVIVRDIATDPLWASYRDVAKPFGLAACWSTPIIDANGRVLGTFAMYYDEPRAPTDADIALTETATLLSANIITRARSATALRVRTESAERLAAALREREEELRASAGRLRAALEASGTSTWRWDMSTNVVDSDEGLCQLFGVDPAEKGSFDVFVSRIHPDDRERVIAAALRCASEGVDLDEEFRVVRPDGSVRWAVDKGKTVFGENGAPQYLIGACVDVTERRMRDEQFHALAESIPQLAWMADASGSIYWYNQRWYEFTGTTLEQMRGWGWKAVHHPDHVDRVVRRIQHSWNTGEAWEDTFPLRGSDGRYRWFLSRAQPIRDADGNIVRWFGTNTDINELREAELARDRAFAEARNERERLYEVFMQAPAAISVLEGPEHIFTVANPLYQKLVGGRDVIGKPVREALPELLGQGFFERLDGVFSSGKAYSERERVVSLDRRGTGVSENVYVDFVYQPLEDASGSTIGILVHAVDVTGQVHARQQIAAARAEAEHANKAKSEFLAAMSHDLRTPINAIGGYADLAAEGVYGPVTEGQRKAMERIRRAGNHLLSLINDILSFAKIEAGRLQLHIADIPLNELIAGAAVMVEPQASKKGLSLGCAKGAAEVQLRGDRERVTQILTNLLTNAVKFTASGSITAEWRAEEHAVLITVRDTGRGIPPEKLAAVFEPFVQAGRSAEEQQQGVGLGLAISRELARAMSGDLIVESVVAQGTAFTLRLPRGEDKRRA